MEVFDFLLFGKLGIVIVLVVGFRKMFLLVLFWKYFNIFIVEGEEIDLDVLC